MLLSPGDAGRPPLVLLHEGLGSVRLWRDFPEALAEASEITGFASLHDYRVAQIKVLMLRGALNGTISGKTALALDYHRIAVLSEGAEENSVEDDAFDVTSLSYAVQIQIKADAWPA